MASAFVFVRYKGINNVKAPHTKKRKEKKEETRIEKIFSYSLIDFPTAHKPYTFNENESKVHCMLI